MDDEIINNVAMSRFELPIADEAVALAYYGVEDGRFILRHTEVPPEYGGQGIGTKLAHAVFERLKAEGRKVVARCPFMAAYAARNPQYAGMIDG